MDSSNFELMKKRYLPETLYPYSRLADLEVGNVVHVSPVRWNSTENVLIVSCEDEFFEISKEELSIYELNCFKSNLSTPKEVYKLFQQDILSCKVCESNGKMYLSRKQNMLDALDFFILYDEEVFYAALLESTSPALAFLEIGAGIIGIVHFVECSNSYVSNATYYLKERIDENYNVPVKIISFHRNDNFKIKLSYKRTFSEPSFKEGDCVYGKITKYLSPGNHSGVFVELHPLAAGILNTDGIDVFNSEEEANYLQREHPYIIIGNSYPFLLKKKKTNGFKLSLIL